MNTRLVHLWFGLAVGLALTGLGSGCGREPSGDPGSERATQPAIGVSLLNLSSEFIVMLNRAMEDQARASGVRLIVTDAQRNAERQVQQVERFVAQGVDAIILNPCEVEAISPAVDRALRAGIPIVNVNSETRSAPNAFVGSPASRWVAVGPSCGRGRASRTPIDAMSNRSAKRKAAAGSRPTRTRPGWPGRCRKPS